MASTITGQIAAALLELYPRQAAPAPVTDGNLFAPFAVGDTSHGGWQKQNRPLVAAAFAAVSEVGALSALWAATRSNKTGAAATSE